MAVATGTALLIAAGTAAAASGAAAVEQRRGRKSAQSQADQARAGLLGRQAQIDEFNRPFRETAERLSPGLESRLLRPVGETVSPRFSLVGKEGLDLLGANAAVSGDPRSGPSQIARGRFLSGLAASESESLIQQQNIQDTLLSQFISGNRAAGLGGVSSGLTSQAATIQGPGTGDELSSLLSNLAGIGTQFATASRQQDINDALLGNLSKTGTSTAPTGSFQSIGRSPSLDFGPQSDLQFNFLPSN